MEHALAIFVYSSVHQQLLVERFNRSANVYLLPLYSVRLYNYSTFDSNNNNKGPFLITKETSTDILFTGSVSERRMTFLNELNRLAIEKSISLLMGKESAWFKTGKISLIDIHTKEFVAATTKVVINFHQQRHSVLETHRIMHLLSYGKCIVSERSLVDPLLDSVYEDRDEGTTNPNGTTAHDTNRAIVFVPLHSTSQEIFQIALYFVRNDTARQLVEERARNLYAKVMGNRLLMHSTISKIFNAN